MILRTLLMDHSLTSRTSPSHSWTSCKNALSWMSLRDRAQSLYSHIQYSRLWIRIRLRYVSKGTWGLPQSFLLKSNTRRRWPRVHISPSGRSSCLRSRSSRSGRTIQMFSSLTSSRSKLIHSKIKISSQQGNSQRKSNSTQWSRCQDSYEQTTNQQVALSNSKANRSKRVLRQNSSAKRLELWKESDRQFQYTTISLW